MTADDAPDLSSPEYHAKFAAVPPRRKAQTTAKSHKITFRLAPDVIASIRASGAGYNRRVEEAPHKAGFGASKTKPTRKAAAPKPTAAKKRA